MKLISKVFLIIIGFYATGCSEENKKERIESDKMELATELPVVDTVVPALSEPSAPEKAKIIEPEVSNKEVSKSEIKLNPAHGEPGHDCAIPVGAPLKTQPQTNTTPTMPQFTMPNSQQTTNSTAGKKLNPAHGEPGHDCAIPVGAPLN